jgi:hypothetical protein
VEKEGTKQPPEEGAPHTSHHTPPPTLIKCASASDDCLNIDLYIVMRLLGD